MKKHGSEGSGGSVSSCEKVIFVFILVKLVFKSSIGRRGKFILPLQEKKGKKIEKRNKIHRVISQ